MGLPSDRSQYEDMVETVDECTSLSLKQSRVYVMKIFFGMKEKEIAEELGICRGNVSEKWSACKDKIESARSDRTGDLSFLNEDRPLWVVGNER